MLGEGLLLPLACFSLSINSFFFFSATCPSRTLGFGCA